MKLERWMSEVPGRSAKPAVKKSLMAPVAVPCPTLSLMVARRSEQVVGWRSRSIERQCRVRQRVQLDVVGVGELGQRAVEHVVGTRVSGGVGDRVEPVQLVVETIGGTAVWCDTTAWMVSNVLAAVRDDFAAGGAAEMATSLTKMEFSDEISLSTVSVSGVRGRERCQCQCRSDCEAADHSNFTNVHS